MYDSISANFYKNSFLEKKSKEAAQNHAAHVTRVSLRFLRARFHATSLPASPAPPPNRQRFNLKKGKNDLFPAVQLPSGPLSARPPPPIADSGWVLRRMACDGPSPSAPAAAAGSCQLLRRVGRMAVAKISIAPTPYPPPLRGAAPPPLPCSRSRGPAAAFAAGAGGDRAAAVHLCAALTC